MWTEDNEKKLINLDKCSKLEQVDMDKESVILAHNDTSTGDPILIFQGDKDAATEKFNLIRRKLIK